MSPMPLLEDRGGRRALTVDGEPFLILSLAALGVNILVGYCGQISLGSGAFMAVGAFATYNFMLRVPGMPFLLAVGLGGGPDPFFAVGDVVHHARLGGNVDDGNF